MKDDIEKYGRRAKFWMKTAISMIFALLVILSVMLYNEIVNEKKLTKYFGELIETRHLLEEIDSAKFRIVKSQDALLQYLISNNGKFVEEYVKELGEISLLLDSVHFQDDSIKHAEGIKITENKSYKTLLDSLTDNILPNLKKTPKKESNYNKLNFKDLVIKATIERKITQDSVEKKGLFSRLGKALRNEEQVREKKIEEKIIVTYFNDKTVGTLEEQFKNLLNRINTYYKKELSKIKNRYDRVENKKIELLKVNRLVQEKSKRLLSEYKAKLIEQEKVLTEKYNVQQFINRQIRLYVLLSLSGVLILLTLIAVFLTRIIYKYENHLVQLKSSLEQNLAIKNRMVGMISHDIRSPLKIISIYIKQLLEIESDTVKKKIYNSINFTTNSSLILANRILDFLKGVEQSKKDKLEEIELYYVINELLKPFVILAKSNKNNFINKNNVNKNFKAKIDIQELQRLYFNLIDNAIKFTQNGTIEVISDIKEYEKEKYRLLLTVKDSGKGIEVERLKNIFNFVSEDDTKNSDISAGLGLHLCKEIVNSNGGEIKIESKPNRGTKIELYLNILKV